MSGSNVFAGFPPALPPAHCVLPSNLLKKTFASNFFTLFRVFQKKFSVNYLAFDFWLQC